MRCFRPCTAAVILALLALLPASQLAQAADLPAPANPFAGTPLLNTGAARPAVLPADEAFVLSAITEADHDIVLLWDIHSGHYLYHKSLQVSTANGTALTPALPEAVAITDEYFGAVDVYYDRLLLTLPAAQTGARAGATVELQLVYQGCAQDLYCYPPQQKTVTLTFPD